jgi:large repetitive protein
LLVRWQGNFGGDSDNNNIPDSVEGFTDHDGDGIPSITERGDDPENCDEDADCDVQPGSLGCNDKTGSCEFPRLPGGEGGTGNEPTAGAPATDGNSPSTAGSSTAEGGNDGAPEGGRGDAEGGGSNAEGGRGDAEGGNDTDRASSSNDSGGCGCSVAGRPTSSIAALALLALALVRRRSRRAQS